MEGACLVSKNGFIKRRRRGSRSSAILLAFLMFSIAGCGRGVVNPGSGPVAQPSVPQVSQMTLPPSNISIQQVPVSHVIELPQRDQAQEYHQVQQGETFSQIARRYGISTSQLLEANGLEDSAALQPGQLLYVPTGR